MQAILMIIWSFKIKKIFSEGLEIIFVLFYELLLSWINYALCNLQLWEFLVEVACVILLLDNRDVRSSDFLG